MKKTILAAALALSLLGTSCLGPDNAWEGLHEWNKKASDNKWANEGIFLALTIIPVYGIFYLGDIIIFNSMEFWGAKNPIDAPKK
jgi:hypothetical protein